MNQPSFVKDLQKLNFINEVIPTQIIETKYGNISFVMFGETTEFRVRTLFTKEPETLSWIDTFRPGDSFWDIGANIGCYSLYAACRENIKVFAFEPSPVNFWLLTYNTTLNHYDESLTTYPFALSESSGVTLWSPHISPGSADNQIYNKGRKSAVQTYSIDELIMMDAAGFPNHIKIDVDGIELSILTGAKLTLMDSRLSSVMVEVDERDNKSIECIKDLLIGSGFDEPITRHGPYFDDNHYLPGANYLFKRDCF